MRFMTRSRRNAWGFLFLLPVLLLMLAAWDKIQVQITSIIFNKSPTKAPVTSDSANSQRKQPAIAEGEPSTIHDAKVLEEVARVSDITQPRGIRHYLYFLKKEDAHQVAAELRNRGFQAKEDRSAYGVKWLVLASHTVVLTGEYIAATRQAMEKLVEPFGGEYDGWEAEISVPSRPVPSGQPVQPP
jgi:hypothetical protein